MGYLTIHCILSPSAWLKEVPVTSIWQPQYTADEMQILFIKVCSCIQQVGKKIWMQPICSSFGCCPRMLINTEGSLPGELKNCRQILQDTFFDFPLPVPYCRHLGLINQPRRRSKKHLPVGNLRCSLSSLSNPFAAFPMIAMLLFHRNNVIG